MKVAQSGSQSQEEAQELNEPIAIFELSSTSSVKNASGAAVKEASNTNGVQVARFEMTKEQVANLLEQFSHIQSKIDAIA